MSIQNVEKDFRHYVKKMSHYEEVIGLTAWDLRTGAPKKGVEQRSEVIGTLSTEVFRMSVSKEMETFLDKLEAPEVQNEIDDVTKHTVRECRETFDKNTNVPEEEYEAFVILTAQAESVWEEAKDKQDFEMFKPYLEKIVRFNQKYVEWQGYSGHKYNTLLHEFEPGLTVETLDRVFTELKEALIPLVKRVTESSSQPETNFLYEYFPKEEQRAFSEQVLESMQYDFEAGRLDETVHPFAIGLNANDVRVTTKYDENDFRTAVFGTIHEGGHALYEQNIDAKYKNTPLCTGTSMGIHESQSLFWENFVGRHYAFWEAHYDLLKQFNEGQFKNIGLDDFYCAINVAGPSFIRIEADEMTYSLHIILRYELEKALINGELEVNDLPQAWNDKMEEYFGIRPRHDGEGVLQDVHWAGGMFGYFPSYALGYVYAAQLKDALIKDIGNFETLLQEGRLAPIKEWMTKHVHQFGKSKQPLDILRDATGSSINAQPLLNYLRTKYEEIYRLN
ncbi:carboxypeptidase Taq [Texcoconibacillus texcoconensis]|uniref:Metal-dependent carboxypeptidase n=1 Tax=Texcoconibacillus texcoconensis TaxID=1095777 RepID=A0A840QT84_9BACI|nr:carboxypeptidase M32 [Texcoconibacillus texcoconensis]MBB5174523.1 carboxypeptidase Taq [Texcoconibacillus texcoconensis]